MFKYFKLDEFDCQETGDNEISEDFVHELDKLREACGFSFKITSGYRSREHSVEKRKQNPGTHAQGIAADIAVQGGAQRMLLVKNALELGFTGIGVARTFIHVDIRETTPVLWCY
jgi:uncharacterized protein YcbK (DUF882 family)|tara:strand:+ start:6200 stop:6544 length:345 start_codon:yes stop_codon:yes gene_type:complete